MRLIRKVMICAAALAALWSTAARAMTPGSMLGVCYSDGKCEQLEGTGFAAIVAQLKAAGELDSVRQVSLRQLQQPVTVSEVVRAFGKLAKLELEYSGEADVTRWPGWCSSKRSICARDRSPRPAS